MEQVVTLSVDELQKLIRNEVKREIENAKPVKDKRMKDLEMYFREQLDKRDTDVHWYHSWNAVRSSIALRMGFKSAVKVTADKYDEFLERIKCEIDEILKNYEIS